VLTTGRQVLGLPLFGPERLELVPADGEELLAVARFQLPGGAGAPALRAARRPPPHPVEPFVRVGRQPDRAGRRFWLCPGGFGAL